MIGRIKSAWVRRPLVVLAAIVFVPLCFLADAIHEVGRVTQTDGPEALRHAWRGPDA